MSRDDDHDDISDDSAKLELDAADRDLIDRLRRLPPEGDEPDWVKLAAHIRAEVGTAAPIPWWKNWRWIIPIWALCAPMAFMIPISRAWRARIALRTAATRIAESSKARLEKIRKVRRLPSIRP